MYLATWHTQYYFKKMWDYLGVKTHEVFLCFVAIVRVMVYYVDFFVLFVQLCIMSLVSVTGSYTKE